VSASKTGQAGRRSLTRCERNDERGAANAWVGAHSAPDACGPTEFAPLFDGGTVPPGEGPSGTPCEGVGVIAESPCAVAEPWPDANHDARSQVFAAKTAPGPPVDAVDGGVSMNGTSPADTRVGGAATAAPGIPGAVVAGLVPARTP
jgi:hypothetical protein